MVYYGGLALSSGADVERAVPQLIGAAAGLLILAGLWTPVAGTIAAGVELWIAFFHPGNISMPIILAILGVSLAMIGPGAWSVDARLFGRKQIAPDL